MAHTDFISERCLDVIADKIGKRLGSVLETDLSDKKIRLAESLQVCFLTSNLLSSDRLADVTEETERFHHQIRFDDKAEAYARTLRTTTSEGGLSWSVLEVGVSPLAAVIDNGIVVIENSSIPGDPLVRLLEEPSYQIHVLWLIYEHSSSVVVVDTPKRIELPMFTLIDESDFLKLLSRGEPIVGIYE